MKNAIQINVVQNDQNVGGNVKKTLVFTKTNSYT